MSDPTVPEPWAYHRNGVCGHPFRVAVLEGALCVEFDEYERGGGDVPARVHRVAVPLSECVDRRTEDPEPIRVFSDCGGSAWLISDQEGYEDDGTFVALHAPRGEVATAVLRVDLLPSVEFGVNSWRGDHWHDVIAAAHEMWHGAEAFSQ